VETLGPDLSLTGIIASISTSRDAWMAFSKFSEDVMRKKEDAERVRQSLLLHDPG